jgi:hypothetical protein
MSVNRQCNIRKWTHDQKRSGEDSTIIRPHKRNSEHVEPTANVIIVTAGTISKSLRQHLSNIPGNHEINL